MVSGKGSNLVVGGGLAILACGAALFPYVYTKRMKREHLNLTQKHEALQGSQVIRGAYINTGSKDIGADPDWDWKNKTYKGIPINPEEAQEGNKTRKRKED